MRRREATGLETGGVDLESPICKIDVVHNINRSLLDTPKMSSLDLNRILKYLVLNETYIYRWQSAIIDDRLTFAYKGKCYKYQRRLVNRCSFHVIPFKSPQPRDRISLTGFLQEKSKTIKKFKN
jgi:hypothetical protein